MAEYREGTVDNRLQSFRAALDARPAVRFHYWLVLLIALLLITDGYDTQAIGYVAPALTNDWGLARSAFGPVFSIGLFGVMIGALTVTLIADRIGARRVLLVCTGVFGLLTLLTATVNSISTLMFMRFISGIALGGAMPVAIALISDYVPTRIRATMITIAVCGFSMGGAFGGVVATIMIADFGWQAVFLVGGCVPLLLLPVLMKTLPESVPYLLSDRASPAALASLQRVVPGWTLPPSSAGETRRPRSQHLPVSGLFTGGLAGSTVLIWVVYFMNLLVLYTLSNWLPSIITAGGLSLETANFATTCYQLGGTLGAVLIAYLCDRYSSQRVLAIAFLSAALSVVLIGAAGDHALFIVLAVTATGFCVVGGQNAVNAFVGSFYPPHVRATGIGWALGIGRWGSIIGPLVVGALIAAGVQTTTLFRLCGIPAMLAACAIWFVGRQKPPGSGLKIDSANAEAGVIRHGTDTAARVAPAAGFAAKT